MTRFAAFAAALSLLAPVASAQAPAPEATPAPKAAAAASAGMTDTQKTLYALGVWLAGKVDVFALKPSEVKTVEKGFEDASLHRKLQADMEQYAPKINDLAQQRMTAGAQKRKDADASFVAKALKEPGAKKLASGLIFVPLKPGKGDSPKATDTVKVDYEGKLTDGSIFDSSIKRGQPAEFPLNGVIPCWTEGVQLMKPGETARLICPSSIAYGDQGRPPQIPGGATLDFTVTLIEIVKK